MADFRAKRSSVLENLKKDISKGFLDKTVTVQGHTYKLKTLTEDDEVWADGYMRTGTTMAIVTSRRAPRLAAAIVEIDGVLRDQLFLYPDDMPQEVKKGLDENSISKRYWILDQMLYFLLEDANRPLITELYDHYDALDKAREEAIKKLPN